MGFFEDLRQQFCTESMQVQKTVVTAALTLILFAGIFLLRYRRKRPSLPPGNLGFPLVGETLQLHRKFRQNKPQQFFDERVNKFGHVFKTQLAGHATVVVTGASGNRLLLANENKLVVASWPRVFIRLIGEDSLLNKFGEEHRRLRAALMAFLSPEGLQNRVGKMSSIIRRHLDEKWRGRREVKVLPLIRELLVSIACGLFFSIENKHTMEQISELLEAIIKGSLSVPIHFPGTRYRRAIEARSKLDSILLSLVERKRNNLRATDGASTDNDFMSILLTLTDESGKQLTDKEIIDNISLLLHAGYDTTTSALTMMLKLLSSNQSSYEEMVKEQMQIIASKCEGEDITWKDTRKMKYTWQVAQETMRMFPPFFGTFRKAITDIEYGGYTIPKGWKLLWTAYSTHLKAEYFNEPEKFMPSRFDDKAAVAPYTFLPFSGGARICPGIEFAKIEILLFMHHFVKNYSGYLAIDPGEKITLDPNPLPVNGFPIQLFPKY